MLVLHISERGLVHREEMATSDVRKPSCYRDTETANAVTPTFLCLRNPAARTRVWWYVPTLYPSGGDAGSS